MEQEKQEDTLSLLSDRAMTIMVLGSLIGGMLLGVMGTMIITTPLIDEDQIQCRSFRNATSTEGMPLKCFDILGI